MIVQACLNGARPPSYHPKLPATPAELAADANAAVVAGAAEIHLHVRATDGGETLAADGVNATIGAVRAVVPGTLIGISTGAWIERDDDRRLAAIATWRILPDYASVNLSEPDAPAVFERLHRRGIGIEAGIASAADAERLIRLGLAPLALRILVEVNEQDEAEASSVANVILATLASHGIAKPILLHGFDDTVWRFVARAAREGYSTRVGLEDGASMPDGALAGGNADLVAAAVALLHLRQP